MVRILRHTSATRALLLALFGTMVFSLQANVAEEEGPGGANATPRADDSQHASTEARALEFSEQELEQAAKNLARRQLTAELVFAHRFALDARIPGLMNRLAAVAPESAELSFFHALGHYRAGEKGQALVELEQSLRRNVAYSRSWNLRGLILSEADRLPEAVECFENAIQYSPYDPTYVYNLASTLYRLNRHGEALEIAERAIRLKPNLAEAFYLTGLIHRERRDIGAAVVAFGSAHYFGMQSSRFLLDYLQVAEAAGEERVVLELLEAMADRDETEVLRNIARLRLHFGEYAAAVTQLQKLCAKTDATPGDRRMYAYALARSGTNGLDRLRRLDIPEAERETLIEYYQTTLNNREANFETRDPILNPIR
ncbi:MAG: tetratricopeptide repeat protein [Spirochaetales bacterium]|nr:tetratricopeptide repeat protein [Leptospiraceae bacterium]MCP5483157.1 tetratricopeptide repeat protein [Spirochaetales bacterium]MCP5484597.1 tetratricopeptide repeat protein [Spirochaetales bacterium]